MAYLAKGNKPDLFSVCEEMGVEVDQSSKVVDIKKLILNSEFYVEEEVKIILDRVISDRKERERSKQEEKEREDRSKQEEREDRNKQEREERSKQEKREEREERMARESRQHELELRKLEFSQQNRPLNDESGRRVKAELAQVPKKDWVAYLLTVLPAELSNMLAREPTERVNNYDFVKDLVLKRYRLNSEKLKQCFYRHQKSAEKSWRNYAHELNSYFTKWIAELQVRTFEQLKDLLITEQLKYRVPAEVREHFLDDWIKLKTPYELAEKSDEYESIKQSFD
ncbi:SCAN box domain-containing protein [Trichonephila clavipes]|uniref:SCAN box domain-containing protein n=1 Tax=Trichonephila clavipes TaxID=2585209 RepID=A0A8X6SVZ4_TRICX|nr:SCAN box domain-containing protein [Trichonephila clavipes]